MKPRFLSLQQILRLHRQQIELYGGTHGVNDQGLLESALSQPEAGFGNEYVHQDVFEMAAAYLFHLVQNHPFRDGNKRIGAIAAGVFLLSNDLDLAADEDEFEALVMATAQGKIKKPEIAEFFRKNTSPIAV